jgi:predicted O-methyltransferase YrrM
MMIKRMLRRLVPYRINKYCRETYGRYLFGRLLRRWLKTDRLLESATPELLEKAIGHWGNDWAARADYLRECLRLAEQCDGPILECGSGLSTIFLAAIVQRTGNRLYTLEHDREWWGRVKNSLRRFGISASTTVVHAELKSFGAYSWYHLRQKEQLPQFGLVVCDGPPGVTPGGRYGLLPQLREHLLAGCTILLDDADRPGESQVLQRWSQELGVPFDVHEGARAFARVTVPAAHAPGAYRRSRSSGARMCGPFPQGSASSS